MAAGRLQCHLNEESDGLKFFFQRVQVSRRLLVTLTRLALRRDIEPWQVLPIEKRGNGLSSTFIVGRRLVIKVRNELAGDANRTLYNGRFGGLFFYEKDEQRLRKEFRLHALLHEKGLSPEAVFLTPEAMVTRYVASSDCLTRRSRLSKADIRRIFDVILSLRENGIFHGDLNLGNFLPQNSRFLVTDFESSREAESPKLYTIDLVIFVEKLHRFHREMFLSSAGDIRLELVDRRLMNTELTDVAATYLLAEAYDAIFGAAVR